MAATTTTTDRRLAAELTTRVSRLSRQLAREVGGVSRTQISTLTSLRDGGPQRITEIARAEHVTQPAATTMVSRLEAHGWVERRPDPADGRAVLVAITPAGRAALRERGDEAARVLGARLAHLEPAERAALAAALPALDKLIGR
jgi:DNA-binding MarR family transcriptional regulator